MTLSARCTEKEKKQIDRNVEKSGKSAARYIVDSCIAAKERKTDIEKRYVTKMIRIMEVYNQLEEALSESDLNMTAYQEKKINEKLKELGGTICQY